MPGTRPGALRILLHWAVALLLSAAAGGLAAFALLVLKLPDITNLDKYDPAASTKIFASDGTLIATLLDENRSYVRYDSIPEAMVAPSSPLRTSGSSVTRGWT